ncbi:uncharacterized protein LOC135963436 [Calliphora vicina]|uniref:uncharacterized protein LOC135963436 n=1 Tax=Calliphora vicina TaxID=7373 RepID=UPI00325C1993
MKISKYFLLLLIQTIADIHSTAVAHEFKPPGNLIKLINEIYYGINATTLVIFNYETKENEMWFSNEIETESEFNLWPDLEQPKLLLQKDSQLELRQYFNADVLVVVMKQEYLNVWDWQHFIKAMQHWTRTDVLFVRDFKEDDDDEETSEEMLQFFRTAWEEGFFNVLLSDFKGELLYTFTAFPIVEIETISVPTYIQRRKTKQDAQGYPIRSSAGNNPPRSFVYYNEANELEYKGLAPQLVSIFAQHYNFSIDWIVMPNFKSGGMADCLKYLLTETVDICSEFLPLNEQSYAIAFPIYIIYGYALVPFAPHLPMSKYLLHPFHQHIWCLMILGVVSTTVMLSLINRFKLGRWQLSSQFMKAIKFLLYIIPQLPVHWGLQKYLIFFIFVPCTFILSNLYMTFLTSILTSNVFEPQINSLEELKERKISILITESDMEILSMYNSFEPISDNYVKIDVSSYVELRNTLNNHFAYISFEDKAEFYLYQQKFLQRPRLRMMPKPLSALWANIPMPHNWPFMDLFNQYMLYMFDTGIIRHLQERSKEDGIRLGYIRFLKTEYHDVTPLDAEYFEIPAIILAVGYLSALVCFIVENVLYFVEKIKKFY